MGFLTTKPLNFSRNVVYHRENTASNNRHSPLFYSFKSRRSLSTRPSEQCA